LPFLTSAHEVIACPDLRIQKEWAERKKQNDGTIKRSD
jgi:hypothetical protein